MGMLPLLIAGLAAIGDHRHRHRHRHERRRRRRASRLERYASEPARTRTATRRSESAVGGGGLASSSARTWHPAGDGPRARGPEDEAGGVHHPLGDHADRLRVRRIPLGIVFPGLRNPVALVVAFLLGLSRRASTSTAARPGRLKAFNAQLPDTITLLANSLRAGSSFLQGMELVTREARPPISEEFERVVREMQLGVALQPALNNLVRRVASEDLELMVTAIQIQSQVGGNLATVLDAIAHTIRERIRIYGEIQTLTAMQRYSGYVITLLPIGLAGAPLPHQPDVHDGDAREAARAVRPADGRRLLHHRPHQHGNRLHLHPPHRRHQGVAR